ncbi:MAG: NAD-dependent protein deacylase [bacterium]|nr:NAD-dependent protein deacylase [bacterium]
MTQLSEMIAKAQNIVFFGGAGVSTASGIPDFRSAHGLYSGAQGRSYEEMLSHGYFMRHNDAFWAFYKNVMLYPDAKPNAAHLALARLEKQGKLKAVLTQNIDGLHQLAGSQNVLELHGTVHRNFCMQCGWQTDLAGILAQDGAPVCPVCGGRIKPDVVLYGEMLDEDVTDRALTAIAQCDLLIVGGTSLVVHPAAGFITYRRPTTPLVLINRDETPYDDRAQLVIHEDIAKVLDEAIPL